MADKTFSLDDLLGTNRKTYLWNLPEGGAGVRLRRLTHGEVAQLNQDFRDAGNRITETIQDRIVSMGLVEPAVTVEQLREAVGGNRTIGDIYLQVASECGFITDLRGEKPTVYIPAALDPVDDKLLAERFTIVNGPRPAEPAKGDDADPLTPTA